MCYEHQTVKAPNIQTVGLKVHLGLKIPTIAIGIVRVV